MKRGWRNWVCSALRRKGWLEILLPPSSILKEGVEKMEQNSSWRCTEKGQDLNAHKLQQGRLWPDVWEKISLRVVKHWDSDPERQWNCHPWRYPKPKWTRPWATWAKLALLWVRDLSGDIQRSLPNKTSYKSRIALHVCRSWCPCALKNVCCLGPLSSPSKRTPWSWESVNERSKDDGGYGATLTWEEVNLTEMDSWAWRRREGCLQIDKCCKETSRERL